MTTLAWIAIAAGPSGLVIGLVLGYLRGVGANHDEVRAQAKRIGELEQQVGAATAALRAARDEALALAAPRMSAEQRRRVLDRVSNGSAVH